MQMETFMRESGVMIKHMVKELTLIPMELITKENGMTISKKDLVSNPGPMVQNMKEYTRMERSMGREN